MPSNLRRLPITNSRFEAVWQVFNNNGEVRGYIGKVADRDEYLAAPNNGQEKLLDRLDKAESYVLLEARKGDSDKSKGRNPSPTNWKRTANLLIRAYTTDILSMMRFMDVEQVALSYEELGESELASDSSSQPPRIILSSGWVGQPRMSRWAKGDKDEERRKQVMHELIHIGKGWDHKAKIAFNTDPRTDEYSWKVYEDWKKAGRQ